MRHPFSSSRLDIIAHAGGSHEAPPNSWQAASRCDDHGWIMETDVQLTRDGIVILMHDETVDRTTNGSGAVSDLTWDDVATLDIDGAGAPPRLDELLTRYPDLRLNIDAKTDEVALPLVSAVREAGAQARVCLASFATSRIQRMRAAAGPMQSSSLGRGEVIQLLVATYTPGSLSRITGRRVPGPAQNVVAVQVPIHRFGRILTPAFVRQAHNHDLKVHAWTINDPDEMVMLMDMGVDGIVTDAPTTLAGLLAG